VDVILDGAGCFTDGSAEISTNGMFKPVTPVRLLDTRGGAKMQPGETRFVQVEGKPGFDFEVSAVVGNVTGTQSEKEGFVTADGEGRGGYTSILNLIDQQTKPNGGVVPLSENGSADGVYLRMTDVAAHMLFDATGGFIKSAE